jgi:hypothetical protein
MCKGGEQQGTDPTMDARPAQGANEKGEEA